MKDFYKKVIIICSLIFCLFFFVSPSQSYYGGPGPYPFYQPSSYSSQPINININLGGYPGSYSSGFPPQLGMMNNYIMQGPYGMGGIYGYSRASSSSKADNDKFSFIHSASDGEYIYLPFDENGGQARGAVAILEASGSDDYEYLSHVTLGKDDFYATSASKMIIKDNLLVIGAMDEGAVYLVDVSDKAEPELINKLNVGEKYQIGNGVDGVTGLAIEGDVLFVSIKFMYSYKHIIFSLDISDPEDTDEDDDVLDYYILEADDCQEIYTMASTPDYLYIAAKYDYDPTILIMDISHPDDLSLDETLDMKGEGELSIAINGDYLLATVEVEDSGEGACKFKIVDISSPETPEIISSSDEFSGQTDEYGTENMVIKDNYAYVFLSVDTEETKIYVFDISDPQDPDLVETSRSVNGDGLTLYLVGNNKLCLHTTQTMKIFDISDPEDISVDETVDVLDILEDELDDWGDSRSSSSSSSYYGISPFGNRDYYGSYPLGIPYEGYDSWRYSGWGGSTYSGYGGYGSSYGGYGGSGYSGWGSPMHLGYMPGSEGWNNFSWGGPPYGNYGTRLGYSGWGSWY